MADPRRQQWRQGDILIEQHSGPIQGQPREGCVLYAGEATGHAHRVEGSSPRIFETTWTLFLQCDGPMTITHDEHGPISLRPGTYRVWRQREYSDGGWRNVND